MPGPFTRPTGPANPGPVTFVCGKHKSLTPRGFTNRIDRAFKSAVREAKAFRKLQAAYELIEADGGFSNHFVHFGQGPLPQFIVLINNGASAEDLQMLEELATKANYKVEATINKAVVVLSNLTKLPDNVKVFSLSQEREM